MPASQLHLDWTAAKIHPTPSPLTSPFPSPVPPPSGGRDASAVESCSWLGHHWLMPGTRSSEYAHLAASPSDSCPDMEREGGKVCVLARESGGRSRAGSSPRLHHQSPPLPPNTSTLAPPPAPSLAWSSSAGSRGVINSITSAWDWSRIWRGASQRAIKRVMQRTPSHSRTQRGGHCTALSPSLPQRTRLPARRPCAPGVRPPAPPTGSPTPSRPRPPSGPWPLRLETRGERLEVE